MRLRSLAGHARRSDGGLKQALLHRHGHEEEEGSQGLSARLGKLSRQAVTRKSYISLTLTILYFNFSISPDGVLSNYDDLTLSIVLSPDWRLNLSENKRLKTKRIAFVFLHCSFY